ncbi:MAG: phosphate/phosphite/phosphonate ABC transporter substrate-binding protein [Hyphomicrobiales bacterium]|nr:phosphate/phosphite/phosphonate ABC transporter substrate-binding protein [Hyphomicrobiales bacterium]
MIRRNFLMGTLAGAALLISGGIAEAEGRNPDTLRVALLPDENASTIIQNAQPFKEYLGGALDKEIELVVTTDYSSMIEAMRFGRIDVAYFGPLSYVLAKSRAPEIEAFAVGVSRGSPTYKSVIITQADSLVQSIDDIKGRTMGFGDNASTSSHLIPRAFLARHELEAETDYEFAHLGTHDAVARAVEAGNVDAGGLSQEIFNSLIERGSIDSDKVKVLAESDPIPNYPMVYQGDLAPELKDAIKQAFLDLDDEAILQTFRAEGFVATDDGAYDILRETAKVLNLDLAKFN